MEKRILSVFLVLLMIASVIPQTVIFSSAEIVQNGKCGEKAEFTLDSKGTLTIKGSGPMNDYAYGFEAPWYEQRGSVKKIVIEKGITSIGNHVFRECDALTEITIPDGVTSIGDNALESCILLAEVTLPNSLTSIGGYAFCVCSALTEITIPASVTAIGYNAFLLCEALEKINVNVNNKYYSDDSGVLFNKDKTLLIRCPIKVESLDIPAVTTAIGHGAFSNCSNISEIRLPDSVNSIAAGAFYNCSSLKNIEIPEGVDAIKESTFAKCILLEKVTIPSSVVSIGQGAFLNCALLKEFEFPEGLKTIECNAFQDCYSIEEISLPAGLTTIEEAAFFGCASLKDIKIPASVESIGDNVFCQCISLEKINVDKNNKNYSESSGVLFNHDKTLLIHCPAKVAAFDIPAGVKVISASAFEDCSLIEKINLPDSVENIGCYAFKNCTSLKKVTVPDKVTSIESCTFLKCSSLEEITIPAGVTFIGENAFEKCSSLKKISLPSALKNFGMSAFEECTSLAEIEIPAGVKKLSYGVFEGCSSLKKITIPKTVEFISGTVLSRCPMLECIEVDELNDVYSVENGVLFDNDNNVLVKYPANKKDASYIIPGRITEIGAFAFSDCQNLKEITLHDNLISIRTGAFDSCVSVKKITIPGKVSNLTDRQFYGCSSLEEVELPASLTDLQPSVFKECCALKKITVDKNNKEFSSENGVLFNKDKSALLLYPACKPEHSYSIPDSVKVIAYFAFYDSLYLTEIKVNKNITNLPDETFGRCKALKKIEVDKDNPEYSSENGVVFNKDKTELLHYPVNKTGTEYRIPDSVQTLGSYAFVYNKNLKKIFIPEKLKNIPSNCIVDNILLQQIEVDKNNNVYSSENGVLFTKDKKELLAYPTGKTDPEYRIPDGVEKIGAYSFYDCQFIKKVFIPYSVDLIMDVAFFNCTSLNEVIINDDFIYIGDAALGYVANEKDFWLKKNDNLIISGFKPSGAFFYSMLNGFNFNELCRHENTKEVAEQPATCTKNGFTAGVYCNDCKTWLSGHDVIPATGHKWNEGKVTKAPTCTDNGIFTYTCKVCGETKTESIPYIGDISGDGKITSEDARFALRTSVNLEKLSKIQFASADTNKDGKISADDARFILRYSVGLK